MLIKSKFAQLTGWKENDYTINLYAKALEGGEKFLFKAPITKMINKKMIESVDLNDKNNIMIFNYVDKGCDKYSNECTAFSIKGEGFEEYMLGSDFNDYIELITSK